MANKNTIIFIIAVLVVVLVTAVIFLPGDKKSSDKVSVVASFYPLYFFTQQIGGYKIDVTDITPAGAEPHDYEPTSFDMVKIEESNLIVLNGYGLEPWADNLAKNINKESNIIKVAEGLAERKINENGGEIIDPHVWLSPILANKMVNKIANGLIQIDPNNKDYYERNASDLKNKLSNLDDEYKSGFKNCDQKIFVTSHAAFGYLAGEYELSQVPIVGLPSDIAEPSIEQLITIVKFVKMNNIKVIFFEKLSPKLSQTIAQETGAQALALNPLETLTKEELNSGADYFTIMRDNLANLRIALSCK